MTRIIPRAEWHAREPRARTVISKSKRTAFAVHYSGADKHQTVRSIQDYHMDVRDWTDIGYNFVIDQAGNIYEGRGWDFLGAHIAGHNTENVGVCAIGNEGDFTDAQKRALVWLYEESGRHFGRQLRKTTHQDVSNVTDCPGTQIEAWVHQGMPLPGNSAPKFPGKVMSRSTTFNTDVRTWQSRMHARGWTITVDGLFGPQTQRVVKAFQAEKHLKVTGTINKETWNAAWTLPVT